MTKLFFLSPIISLIILFFIIYYVFKKAKNIKIEPKDQLHIYKLKIRFIENFYHKKLIPFLSELEKIFSSFYKKFLQRIKTEALKTQIWAEKQLEKFKE